MNLYALFTVCRRISYEQTGVSANYAIKRDGRTLYLFFQDSDGLNDWKSNLNFPAKAYKRMGKTLWFAHRGFVKVWKEIQPMLEKDIADPYFEKIVITGYSHGAAIALLCHEYVWFHRKDLRETTEGYGFGCPRVFWGIPTKRIKRRWSNFTVIRNLNDLVTHLPPAFLGYAHVSKILKIGVKGKYTPIQAHYAKNISRELQAYENK